MTAATTRKSTGRRRMVTHTTADAVSPRVVPLSLVPGPEFHDTYISRTIGGKTEFEIFDVALSQSMNVLLEGPTGPGKTSAVMAYAAMKNRRYASVPSNVGIDPGQLFGMMYQTGHQKFEWQDGPVTDVVRHGGVLLINEVNFMPPRIATALFSLLDKRRAITLLDNRGELVRAHHANCWCPLAEECPEDNWVLIVADMNPSYEGTQELNKALRNRFAIQLPWDYDPAVEAKLIRSDVLLELVKNQRNASDEFATPASTNMMMEFERLVPLVGLDFAIDNFVQHFAPDERPGIRAAFEMKRDALEESYRPPVDDGFEIFNFENAKWMMQSKSKRRN